MVLYREGKQEWLPFDYTMYCSTASFDAASSVLEEIVASLQSLNITVEQVRENCCFFDLFHEVSTTIYGANGVYCIRI